MFIFLVVGTLITCIVQSSAAVMAITILLCSTGVLPIYMGVALVMGENIGTTATVNVHIMRLRKKLGPYAACIVSRQGYGYVFEEN